MLSRIGISCGTYNNNLFIAGGMAGNGRVQSSVSQFNFKFKAWDERYKIPDLPFGSYGNGMASLSDGRRDVVLTAFGHGPQGRNFSKRISYFKDRLKESEWISPRSGDSGPAFAAAVAIPDEWAPNCNVVPMSAEADAVHLQGIHFLLLFLMNPINRLINQLIN